MHSSTLTLSYIRVTFPGVEMSSKVTSPTAKALPAAAAGATSSQPPSKPASASSSAAPTHAKTASTSSLSGMSVSGGSTTGKSPRVKPPSPESVLVDEALQTERGEAIAVECVQEIVKKAMDKLTEHYIQQVAMKNTAKQAIDFVMQAIEWQLLVHDDGEKLTVRKVLADKQTNPQPDDVEAAVDGVTPANSSDPDLSPSSPLPAAPSPIDEPENRSRPAMDLIAAKLSLPTTYNQLWTCEEEPLPADLDRWARGVIPTKATEATVRQFGMSGTSGAFTVHEVDESRGSMTPRSSTGSLTPNSQTPSRSGLRSPGSASLHGRGGSKSILEEKEGFRSPGSQQGSTTRSRITDRDRDLHRDAPPQPYALDVSLSKEALAKERAREGELKRLEKKKKLEAEQKKVRDADQREKERMERIQTELRHRNYTFDNKGNVVLIAPVPVERFPAFQPAPKLEVKEIYLTEEEEAEIRKREKRNRFKKAGISSTVGATTVNPSATGVPKDKQSEEKTQVPHLSTSMLKSSDIGVQKKSPKKNNRPDPTGFVDANATQPSLMQTLIVNKGVTLKQGAVKKEYDPRAARAQEAQTTAVGSGVDNASAELRGLTRKEYLAHIQAKKQADAKFLPKSSKDASALDAVPSVDASASPSPRGPPSRSSRPGSAPRASISSSGGSVDVDPRELEWEGQQVRKDEGLTTNEDALPDVYVRPTTTEAFNFNLTQDPTWGMNPSSGPSGLHQPVPRAPAPKPSERDRVLAVGRVVPRTRKGVDVLTSQPNRQHLAPAPYGAVTGHGGITATSANHSSLSSPPAPASPSKGALFTKQPPPVTVTATEKAKMYFRMQEGQKQSTAK